MVGSYLFHAVGVALYAPRGVVETVSAYVKSYYDGLELETGT